MFFFAGLIVILIGWPFFTLIGFVLQIWGMFWMFRSFIKTIFSYMQTLPVIGPFIRDSVLINSAVNWIASGKSKGSKSGGSSAKFEV